MRIIPATVPIYPPREIEFNDKIMFPKTNIKSTPTGMLHASAAYGETACNAASDTLAETLNCAVAGEKFAAFLWIIPHEFVKFNLPVKGIIENSEIIKIKKTETQKT